MYNAKPCWYIRHLDSRKQCSLSREHVSIRDREKPRYTIGAWSAWSRICTMDRERYLCWTVLIGLLESPALMLVMPAHSAGGQNRFVGTGVSRCNETPVSTVLFSGSLCLPFLLSLLWSRIRRSRRERRLPTYRRLLSTFVSANLTALYVGKFSRSLEEVYG